MAWLASGRSLRPAQRRPMKIAGTSAAKATAMRGSMRSIITNAPTQVSSSGNKGTSVEVTK